MICSNAKHIWIAKSADGAEEVKEVVDTWCVKSATKVQSKSVVKCNKGPNNRRSSLPFRILRSIYATIQPIRLGVAPTSGREFSLHISFLSFRSPKLTVHIFDRKHRLKCCRRYVIFKNKIWTIVQSRIAFARFISGVRKSPSINSSIVG